MRLVHAQHNFAIGLDLGFLGSSELSIQNFLEITHSIVSLNFDFSHSSKIRKKNIGLQKKGLVSYLFSLVSFGKSQRLLMEMCQSVARWHLFY